MLGSKIFRPKASLDKASGLRPPPTKGVGRDDECYHSSSHATQGNDDLCWAEDRGRWKRLAQQSHARQILDALKKWKLYFHWGAPPPRPFEIVGLRPPSLMHELLYKSDDQGGRRLTISRGLASGAPQ
jgi:hypothetical protein